MRETCLILASLGIRITSLLSRPEGMHALFASGVANLDQERARIRFRPDEEANSAQPIPEWRCGDGDEESWLYCANCDAAHFGRLPAYARLSFRCSLQMSSDGVSSTTAETELGQPPSGGLNLRALAIIFAFGSFLSAFLLFQVQLIVSKYILPWFGGSAAVWTTSMVVFQVLLLGGYVYSHLLAERFSPKAQCNVHSSLLAVGFVLVAGLSLVWPSAITPGPGWKPIDSTAPERDVIVILVVAAGLPFFVLSTTGPLLQRWFARLGGDARTYRLYSVSNLGSLLGLLSFPFLLEPTLRMTSQGRLWAVLFGTYIVVCGWCAWRTRQCANDAVLDSAGAHAPPEQTTSAARVLWFALAACASTLLLATTNLLCQEITSIPLLWVLPLALYLLSFVLCFDHPRWYRREVLHPLFAAGVFALWATMHFALRTSQVVIMPLLLFVTCMICHGELVRLKPDVRRLTSFYLAISAGGALGGVFVALVAPHIFRFFAEFQIALGASVLLLLCCLLRDGSSWFYKIGFGLSGGIIACVFAGAFAAGTWIPPLSQLMNEVRFYPLALLVATLVLVGAYIQRTTGVAGAKGFRAGQVLGGLIAALALLVLYQSAQPDPGLYLGKRNFYGALRVYELAQGGKAMFHGQTLHGAQLNPPNNHLPMAYYGPDSGIGILLQNHPRRAMGDGGLRVGVVGLGAGTLAAYGIPSDYFRYYEINPDVIDLAAGMNPVFTYIRESQARVDTQIGDARLLLEREAASGQAQNFDVLVLDAFSGDAVPVHLLTTEAFDTYWKHVNPEHGVIAIHVSSRHINLMPVIEGIAAHYKAPLLARFVYADYPFLDNLWMILARRPEDLQVRGLEPNPPPVPTNVPPRVWTDDYSDIVRLLY